MKRSLFAVAAAAAILASSAALAEPPNFKAADANGDGGVDADEFAATKIEKEFGNLDKNGDGKLDAKEYAVALEEDCA